MPIYRYEGMNYNRQMVRGKLRAKNEAIVREQLKKRGVKIIHLSEEKSLLPKEINFFQQNRVKFKEFVIYLRQFSTLLKAGISIVDATSILGEQTTSKTLKRALIAMEEDLKAGNAFSHSAEKHKKIFPPLFINMVRAGEAGGNLDEILDRMALYYEKQNKTRQKVQSALTYPAIIGIIMILIVYFLISFVVPRFADMFASLDAELPLITRMVLRAGELTAKYWWTFPIFVIVIILVFKVLLDYKKTRYYLDYLSLKLPIFGTILQKSALARFTRTLGSLFATSVPVLQAVAIVERVIGNEVIAKVIRESRLSLEKGESLATPMMAHWAFPPLVTQMIAVGEKTGSLDTMLNKVAEFYEDEVEMATDQIKSLIEPMLILALAGAVGVIVAAIMIPMFQMYEYIN